MDRRMTDPVEQIRQWAKDAHERYGTIGLCPYRHGTASAEEEAAEKSHAAAAVVVAAGNRGERVIRADGEVASYEVYFVKGAVQLLAALWTRYHSRCVTGSLRGWPLAWLPLTGGQAGLVNSPVSIQITMRHSPGFWHQRGA
jgi:hypothetical protein